ncbi:glycosyltransferase family 4 protein [Planctomycetota bacterium]
MLADVIREKPDMIINVGMSLRSIFLCFYAKIYSKKIIIWWGGTNLSEKNISKFRLLYRKCITRCINGAILYSKYALDNILSLNTRLNRYLILGNNTRDSSRYHKIVYDKRNENNIYYINNTITFITVGFQLKIKNTISVLQAYASLKLKDKTSNIRLLVVGDGPELHNLKTFCTTHHVKDVTFLGYIDPKDLPGIYACSDVFIHPSTKDRWPQTYNEAAASGLAVLISSKAGAYDEYIRRFSDIVLFDPDESHQIEKAMELVICNKQLRNKLKKNALEVAIKSDCITCIEMLDDFIKSFS